MKKKSSVEYFWSKVNVTLPDECWIATGVALNKQGYPAIRWQCKTWTCRKLAWYLAYGTESTGKLIQFCKNKLCCNPAHMYDSSSLTGNRRCVKCKLVLPIESFGWAIKNKRKDTVCNGCNTITKAEYLSDENVRKRTNVQRNLHRETIKDYVNEKARNDPKRPERQRNWDSNNPQRKLWYAAKNRATKKNLPFDITPEDIIIPEKCSVLGLILGRSKGIKNYNSPTVDRIIPSLGYVKGNIRVISFRANTLKNNATVAELEMVLEDARKIHST